MQEKLEHRKTKGRRGGNIRFFPVHTVKVTLLQKILNYDACQIFKFFYKNHAADFEFYCLLKDYYRYSSSWLTLLRSNTDRNFVTNLLTSSNIGPGSRLVT